MSGLDKARKRAVGEAGDRIFTEARDLAVDDLLEEASEQGVVPSAQELRDAAEREREALLTQGSLSEDYRRAEARVPVGSGEQPGLGVWRVTVLFLCVLLTLGTCVLYGHSTAPQGPLADDDWLTSALALAALLAAGAATFVLAWLLGPVDPANSGRRGPPPAAVLWAVGLVGMTTSIGLTYLAAQTANVVALLALGGSAFVWGLAFTAPIRTWWVALALPRAAAQDRERLDRLRRQWREELRQSLQLTLRPLIAATKERMMATQLSVQRTETLKRARGEAYVSTPAERRLIEVSRGMSDGSIALAGPRGVGKTELLTTFCQDPSRLSVVVVAPVAYDRRDFALHLFAEVCRRVQALPDASRPLRRQALQHLRQISYLQTHAAEASLSVPGMGLSLKRGRSRSLQPLTYPEIVHELKGFLTQVRLELSGKRRLVIGIDELDRIQPPTAAQEFLNEIKVIFDVPGCLFVLSVSDEALRAADLAPVGRRDVFDSAIDEVIRVEPLDYGDAARLLASRVIGLPIAFTGLFNALAGGIPRDLLRIARAAILFTDGRKEKLSTTARRLVARELARIIGSSDDQVPPEALKLIDGKTPIEHGKLRELGEQANAIGGVTVANRLFFLDTVLGVFSDDLTSREIPQMTERFTELARIGSRIGTADHQARTALVELRNELRQDPIPPIS